MTTPSPSLQQAQVLLRQYIEDAAIQEHCESTRRKALQIAKLLSAKISVNFDLVGVGALLHDIGRARTHDVTHGYVGGQILELYDYPPAIVNIVERHVLGGFSAEEAVLVGLPERNFIPDTWEEKIVCVADKLGVSDWEGINRPQSWLEEMETRFSELRRQYTITEPYQRSMERAKQFATAMVRLALLK